MWQTCKLMTRREIQYWEVWLFSIVTCFNKQQRLRPWNKDAISFFIHIKLWTNILFIKVQQIGFKITYDRRIFYCNFVHCKVKIFFKFGKTWHYLLAAPFPFIWCILITSHTIWRYLVFLILMILKNIHFYRGML